LEVKPLKDSSAGTTEARKELNVDIDVLTNELENKLRL